MAEARVEVLEAELRRLADEVEMLRRAVFGEGNPGLLERIAKLEAEIRALNAKLKVLITIAIAQVASILGLIVSMALR